MALPVVNEAYYPSFDDLTNVYLRVIKYGFARRGLTANVLPGSEYWYRARAIASQLTPLYANNKLAIKGVSPLEATGQDLVDLAAVFGVQKRASAPATGLIKVQVVSGSVTIPAGYQCTAADGTKYQTIAVATVANNDTVQVIATIGGTATNKSVGDIVTWDSATVGFLKRNASVSGNGLTGGVEEDTEELLRSRFIEHLSSPGFGGNWSFVKTAAENASASISAAFVYPAIQGPASYGIAIVRADGDRTLSSTVVSAVASAVAAAMPGHAKLNTTSVTAQKVDAILKATLPLPIIAGGSGGGWRDATPWPNVSSGNVKVSSYDSSTSTATTNAAALNGLQVGTHIGVWDYADDALVMREYIVSSVALAGTYKIQVVGGFLSDPTGCYISAGAEGLVDYAAAASAAFLKLGPGEKTSSTAVLPRALRRPAADSEAAAAASSLIPAAVSQQFAEILGLDFANVYATGTTTPLTTPSVPAAVTDPPNIIVLKHLAIRQA